jgi:hypothetical protein
MRAIGLTTALCTLLLAQPAFAQEWIEYVNKVDRFSVPAPGEPTTETITWDSEYGAKFPGRVHRWTQGPNRYSITVVDFSDAEKIHAAINHTAYLGGVGYWVIDIAASVGHAARLYREKPGVKTTYDAFHYINLITGHMLQLTNPDASRSYVAIYLHENRLYVLDATVAKGQPPPLIFQQSFAITGPDGNAITIARPNVSSAVAAAGVAAETARAVVETARGAAAHRRHPPSRKASGKPF